MPGQDYPIHPETAAIRIQAERTAYREHSVPLYLTSSFIFDTAEQGRALFAEEIQGNIYSRFSNPNTQELIDKLCYLEHAEDGFAFATGMAAIFSTFGALLSQGDHVVSCRSVFGSTHQVLNTILPKWGITHTYVNVDQPDTWEKAIQLQTRLFFLETPCNPGLDIIDLSFVAALCKKHKVVLVVDNCFATPVLQQPLLLGADLVIHSATKYLDGQGRVLGGIVAGRQDLIAQLRFFVRHTGPAISPFNAWILSKSLETLSLRMEKHCSNALQLATFLQGQEEVDWVKYPFLKGHPQYDIATKQMRAGGGILTICLKGGRNKALQFLDGLQMIKNTANLGDSRTIATHPATTTHSKLTETERLAAGIPQGLVRISAGLENIEDLKRDILHALRS